MEITNLKQVNSDIVPDVDAPPRPSQNGQNRAEEGSALRQRGQEVGIAQGHERGLAGGARRLWERWKRVARKIGDFQARALMTLFYFLILAPVSIGLRWRSDPLAIKPKTPRGWNAMEERDGAPMDRARRQF